MYATEWEHVWHLARLKGLGPEHSSFLLKPIHQLLPVKSRVHRITPNTSTICSLCFSSAPENLMHTFFHCSFNQASGQVLEDDLKEDLPDTTNEKILRLEFEVMYEDVELPAVWFTAAFLLAIWERRTSGTRVKSYF